MGRGGGRGPVETGGDGSGLGGDTGDEVGRRLTALRDRCRGELAGVADVVQDDSHGFPSVSVTPHRAGAVAVNWWDWGPGSRMQVQVESAGGGGVFELLDRDAEAVEFVVAVVEAVIAGRVVEFRGPGRSRVEVTGADGDVTVETALNGWAWLMPRPGWRARAERIRYLPYREQRPR